MRDEKGRSDTPPAEFYQAVYHCLMLESAEAKVHATMALHRQQEQLPRQPDSSPVLRLPAAGVPGRPRLIDPTGMKKRGIGTLQGRIALLHALAHIEFNAINLALDAVYRFRQMPIEFQRDWLQVACEEAMHFELMSARLVALGSYYGALDAHAGLWAMAHRTDHDVMVRMALVPRVLEARGLDVAPPMIDKLRQSGDETSAEILQRIYQDEITHVAIGNRWFLELCAERGLSATDVFQSLLREHGRSALRGPYNSVARVQAGFTEDELEALTRIEREFRHLEGAG